MINDCDQARIYLENKNLMVPQGADITPINLSITLFQISELAKVPLEVSKAIRSVAWLIGELEEETIALSTRTIINSQLDYLNIETKSLMDELRTTFSEQIDKNLEKFNNAATKTIEDKIKQPISYRDIAARNTLIPQGTDPRVIAREGIRTRQFVLDFYDDAPIHNLNKDEILKFFNDTMEVVASELDNGTGKIRSIHKMANKSYLGEFLHDNGAKWFAIPEHSKEFLAALGTKGIGASLKRRNHPMIAYFVPLNLHTENPTHISEIIDTNNLNKDDISKIRWAKPPARRSPNQTCGHLIINFTNPDAANRAKTEGLLICNKKVSVAKFKKEPIRCLKCHGWNHIASECNQLLDRCGTCGAEGHRTSACTNADTSHCINCKTDDHPSWSRNCPTFLRKCQEYDAKHPENNLPYYPSSTDPWTWSSTPQPPPIANQIPRPASPPPIRQRQPTQRLRQQTINFNTQERGPPPPTQRLRQQTINIGSQEPGPLPILDGFADFDISRY
jgi:hypothetical protein